MKLFTFGSKDIGIDLGTANLLVTLKGINRRTGNIVATGSEAKEMLRKNSRTNKCSKTNERWGNCRFYSNATNA